MVLAAHTQEWNRYKRIPWNLVEQPGGAFTGSGLAELCRKLVAPPRYLKPPQIAADVQLQEFVLERCRGVGGNALSAYSDRNRSFDALLCEAAARFEAVHGLDVSAGAVAWARDRLGVSAGAERVTDHRTDRPYDVACLWDTDEHLPDPRRDTASDARRRLLTAS